MRKLLALTGATFGLIIAANFAAPAQAEETATRCGSYGCDRVVCHDGGDRCTRYSDYDRRYNGYTNGGYTNGDYGGYDNYAQSPSYNDNGYYGGYDNGPAYGSGPAYDDAGGYYGGYDSHGDTRLVCDNEGTRCYRSYAPYWDYHEYYRIQGYRWNY
jgi:hypothetical protein